MHSKFWCIQTVHPVRNNIDAAFAEKIGLIKGEHWLGGCEDCANYSE